MTTLKYPSTTGKALIIHYSKSHTYDTINNKNMLYNVRSFVSLHKISMRETYQTKQWVVLNSEHIRIILNLTFLEVVVHTTPSMFGVVLVHAWR